MHTKSELYPSLDTLLQSGLQKRIHSELVAHRRTAAMTSLPTGQPRNGLDVFRPLTTDESAIRRQGIMDRYLQRLDVAAVNPDEINRRADIALIRMGLDGPGTTLIDVTLAAHNIHQPGPDYTVGLAANNSALRKHQFYNRLYQPPGSDTQLVIFAFETSGSIRPEARTFLRDHVAAGTTHNPETL